MNLQIEGSKFKEDQSKKLTNEDNYQNKHTDFTNRNSRSHRPLGANEFDEGEINDEEDNQKGQTHVKKTERAVVSVPHIDNDNVEPQSVSTSHNCLIKESLIARKLQNNRVKSIEFIQDLTSEIWNGMFTLKKHLFPTKFYLIAGSKTFAEQILPQHNSSADNCLRISQRLRLDQTKLEELER